MLNMKITTEYLENRIKDVQSLLEIYEKQIELEKKAMTLREKLTKSL